jgi:hypothetical protein
MSKPTLQNAQENGSIEGDMVRLLMAERQSLIIRLGAIEDFLGMERSITPRHKRRPAESSSGQGNS